MERREGKGRRKKRGGEREKGMPVKAEKYRLERKNDGGRSVYAVFGNRCGGGSGGGG